LQYCACSRKVAVASGRSGTASSTSATIWNAWRTSTTSSIVDVRHRDGAAAAWAAWNSGIAGAIRDYVPTGDPLSDEDPGAGTWVARVPLPSTVEPILGKHARIQLTVTPRS
jgi:hypothetical protein